MSIAGRVARHSDAPVAIDRMLRATTRGGERGWRRWSGDGVRLGASDDGSLATGAGGRACVFDGRIDNGAELAAAIGERAHDDATLALAAHARWGDDFASHILGDFACAIWLGAERRLLLAADPMAQRPLYVHRTNGGDLLFASEPRGLLAEPEVPRDLDAVRIAQWLAVVPTEPERCLYAAIARVPRGGTLTWRHGHTTSRSWWRPLDASMLRLKRHEDYAEAVRDALDTAVAARIAGDARIGTQLSGGLDSGSVTALAAGHLDKQGRPLAAFTATPRHPAPDAEGSFADEWPHASALAARHPNVEHVRIFNDERPIADVLDQRTTAQDTPQLNIGNMTWSDAIDRAARDRGITVLLTGAMGNMSFSYDGAMRVADAARRRDWPAAVRGVWQGARGSRNSMKRMLALAAGALPTGVERALLALAGRPALTLHDYSAALPGLLDGDIARSAGDLRALARGDSRQMRLLALARSDFMGEGLAATRRLYGVDTRDPTLDRRLFELCLSIPEEQFAYQGTPRALARTAMADLLPPLVRDERRRGQQSADWAVAFEAALPALREECARLRGSRAAEWIDLDRVEALLARWPGVAGQPRAIDYLAVVGSAIAAGRFIRRFEGSNA